MTRKSEGVAFTPADVERWLIAAFIAFTGAAVFSARCGRLEQTGVHAAPGTFDWIVFSAEVLGRGSAERLALLTWARSKARRRIRKHRRLRALKDVPGGTVTDFCDETGWKRRTFDRRRKRACRRLAEAWNARRRAAT